MLNLKSKWGEHPIAQVECSAIVSSMSPKYISDVNNPICEPFHRQSNSRQRILVVEDERDLRQITAEGLTDAGYQVDVANLPIRSIVHRPIYAEGIRRRVAQKNPRRTHARVSHHGHRIFAHLGIRPAPLYATRENAPQTLFVREVAGHGKKCSVQDSQRRR